MVENIDKVVLIVVFKELISTNELIIFHCYHIK